MVRSSFGASRVTPPTSTDVTTEADAGEVVALAVGAIDAAEVGGVADALPAVALALAIAGLRLRVCLAAAALQALLGALAARAHVSGVTQARSALQRPPAATAHTAVGLGPLLAAALAESLQLHLQCVLEPHRFHGEVLGTRRALGQLHCHVEGHLRGRTTVTSKDTCEAEPLSWVSRNSLHLKRPDTRSRGLAWLGGKWVHLSFFLEPKEKRERTTNDVISIIRQSAHEASEEAGDRLARSMFSKEGETPVLPARPEILLEPYSESRIAYTRDSQRRNEPQVPWSN